MDRTDRGLRDGRSRLSIDWRETDVASSSSSTESRDGFGREAIEQALPFHLGAHTRYALTADGVRCEILLRLTEHAS